MPSVLILTGMRNPSVYDVPIAISQFSRTHPLDIKYFLDPAACLSHFDDVG
jgi:hypothetical protein